MRLRLCSVLLLATASMALTAAGKNKIIYQEFKWEIYQSQHFKVFFYPESKDLLPMMVDMAEAAYRDVSEKLQHELDFPVPMITFRTHEEFMQNNVFPGFLPRQVAAFAEPFQSRMVLPFDREPEEQYALLVHELTHIFQYDMLFNNRIGTIIRANAPIWLTEGMASWVADDETNLDRMVLRDVAVNSGFSSIGQFSGLSFLAYRVGHAVFAFMEERYGIEGIRNFLWQYRKNVTGSVSTAIERAFETEIGEFDRDFRKYLRKRYIDLLPVKEEPDDHAREIRTRRTFTTLSPELSPSGDLFAAIVPIKNDLDVVLVSTKDGRIFRNLTKGYTTRYTQVNTNGYRGVNDLAWSPDGNQLVFTAIHEGTSRIFVVSVLNGKIQHELFWRDIRDAQSPIFSPDGKSVYFVGNRNTKYDIFKAELSDDYPLSNITQDEFHNRNPKFSPDGNRLLYSSLRNGFYKIFEMDMKTGQRIQLTSGLGNDMQASYAQDMKSIYFSSDRFDDIYNIFELEIETGVKKQYTNILTGAFSPQERVTFDNREGEERKQLSFTSYYQGRYRIYRMDKPEEREEYYDIERDNFSNVKDFNMSANVQLDPRRYQKYELTKNFSINGANVSAGATTDGRFLSNTSISLADTTGDRQLNISTFTVSSFETYQGIYVDRRRRLQWGATATSQQDFILANLQDIADGANPGDRQERRFKINEGGVFGSYPFSLYTRIDAGVGFTDQDRFTIVQGTDTNDRNDLLVANADYSEPYYNINFSVDTVRYREYGPQNGILMDIGIREDLDQSRNSYVDLRLYKELTTRSLLAWRLVGNYSTGDIPRLYTLGGNDDLRGDYDFQEFFGSRRVLGQMELRFPLIDRLQFPGGVVFGNIRGKGFVDVGGTWFNNDTFNFEFQDSVPLTPSQREAVDRGEVDEQDFNPNNEFWNPDNPNPNYLIGSYGVEISFFFGGLDLNWSWSRRTNFDDFPSNSRMTFWIGRSF